MIEILDEMMVALERPKSLTELVTESLRERIVSGEFDLGSQLSEARIAKDLEVSRTPVREAINRLEMEGLLVVEPQRGSFVFNLAPHELARLCDARVCLETAALRAAVNVNSDKLYKALVECVAEMTNARSSGDVSAYLALDTQFHQHFFDAADNRFLNDAYQAIAPKMSALRNRLGRQPDHMEKSFREHRDIANAVGSRNIEAAMSLLKRHIDRKEGSYWNDVTTADSEFGVPKNTCAD